jgi:hypothetical protein
MEKVILKKKAIRLMVALYKNNKNRLTPTPHSMSNVFH